VKPFEHYAEFYDDLYAEKDYLAECSFIEACFARWGRQPRTILDLACGTGGHGIPLAQHGYRVTGVDASAPMLDRYRVRASKAGVHADLHQQRMEELDLGRTFDAAVCMFDAVGYLCENRQLAEFARRVRAHLTSGGVFIVDFWHAAALLRSHQQSRVREFDFRGGKGIRISSTHLDPARQVGTVEFHVLAFDGDRLVRDVREAHTLRYFLPQEMAFILQSAGLVVRCVCPAFDPDARVDLSTWHLVAVASVP
jgi:SAM-dependent methyltransferase